MCAAARSAAEPSSAAARLSGAHHSAPSIECVPEAASHGSSGSCGRQHAPIRCNGAALEPVAEWKPVTRHAFRPEERGAVIALHATFQKRSDSPLRGSEGQERRQCPVQRQRPAPGWRESSPRAAELRCAGGEQPCRPTGHMRAPRAPRRSARPTLGRTLRRTAQRPLPRSGRDVLSNTNRSHGGSWS